MKVKNLFYLAVFLFVLSSCRQDINDLQNETTTNQTINASNRLMMPNVKVAEYNLHLFLFPVYFEDAIRQAKIQEFLKNNLNHNDVVFLSEVWKDVTKNEIIESVKNEFPYSLHTNVVDASMGDGLLILSKFPIKKSQFYKFNNSQGTDALVPKGFHKTLFETPNGDFYAFFTHAQADSDKSQTRALQFQQIKSQMNNLNNTPSIIIGDLNVKGDTSDEYPSFLQIFNQFSDAYRQLYTNSQTDPGFSYSNVTNALAEYFYPKASNGKSNERLDYVLYSKSGWDLVSSKLVTECNYYSPSLKSNVSCSDHFGIETGLVLTKNINNPNDYIANSQTEALQKINNLKTNYGTGLTARTIIYNNTDKPIRFHNKTTWYNSSWYNSPVGVIPSKKYAVVLATKDSGEATGVFNQLTYSYENTKFSLGTYVPWSWAYTNNVLVDFNEISYNTLSTNSTRPSMTISNNQLKITGKISTGDSPLAEFVVENK